MDYATIYRNHADDYDQMVNVEDCDHQIWPAIERSCPAATGSVLEVGAGTGRLSRLLVEHGARLFAFDLSAAMLAVARHHLGPHSALAQADGRVLPAANGWADLAIAGWVFGHMRSWFPEYWRESVTQALDEMRRVLKPGGT